MLVDLVDMLYGRYSGGYGVWYDGGDGWYVMIIGGDWVVVIVWLLVFI